MTTEIRFEAEALDVRAYVDEVGDVSIVLRLDDRDETDRSYVSLAGPPSEIRAQLARLLGVTNAVARSLEELAALEEEPAEVGIVDTGTDWTDEERAALEDEAAAETAERGHAFAAAGGLKDADR